MQKKYVKVKNSKIFNRLAVKLATLFGIGNVQHCSGTVGSLVGTVIYAIIIRKVAILPRLLAMLFILILSLIVCDIAEKALKKHDPQEVIFCKKTKCSFYHDNWVYNFQNIRYTKASWHKSSSKITWRDRYSS